MMIALLVLCTFAFWGAIFLVFFQAEGKTPWDVFLGEFDPLPEDLGIWLPRPDLSVEPDELHEERTLLQPGRATGSLLRQRRIRSRATGEVLRVLSDERIPRRRKTRNKSQGR